jgi:hypothetical protein
MTLGILARALDDCRIIELVHKVADPHLPKNLSPRRLFMTLFIGSIDLLYVEQNADIRLVSLHETHPRLFVQGNAASVRYATASTNSTSQTVAESSPHVYTPAAKRTTDALGTSPPEHCEIPCQTPARSVIPAPGNLAGV